MEACAEASHFSLIHDAKLPKYVDSARWKRGYNPDVAFVKGALYRIWCGVNRLGDRGVKVV